MKKIEVYEYAFDDVSFYVFSRVYPSDEEAKEEYLRLVDISAEEAARRNLAGYRMVWQGKQNVLVIVGHIAKTVAEAGFNLGGEPIELPDEVYRALVIRRVRWLTAANDLDVKHGVYVSPGPVALNNEGEVVG